MHLQHTLKDHYSLFLFEHLKIEILYDWCWNQPFQEDMGNDVGIAPSPDSAAKIQCCCVLSDEVVDLSGDVNNDSIVNVNDIVLIVNHILGNNPLINNQLLAADFNGDGVVNVTDIIQIVDQIMNSGQMTPQQGEQIIDEIENLLDEEIQEPIIDIPVIKPKPVKPTVRPDRLRHSERPSKPVDEKQKLINKILNKQRKRK